MLTLLSWLSSASYVPQEKSLNWQSAQQSDRGFAYVQSRDLQVAALDRVLTRLALTEDEKLEKVFSCSDTSQRFKDQSLPGITSYTASLLKLKGTGAGKAHPGCY